ncbi:hypothetical protein H5410_059313 [Solanum commersonii]|uniref:Uncharacterized protein n=1 Tax=Solanum commersonii TaxID=4109 RepID=A0A9J5W207_SOLCO|nr:hypothetical protein H5410_059313 [Solanum commersonii]
MLDKMREVRLSEHVIRRSVDAPVRRCEQLVVEDARRDRVHLDLTEDMVLDRRVWRSHIRVEGLHWYIVVVVGHGWT